MPFEGYGSSFAQTYAAAIDKMMASNASSLDLPKDFNEEWRKQQLAYAAGCKLTDDGCCLYSDNELKPLLEHALFGFRCAKETTASDREILKLAERLLSWKFVHYLSGDALRLARAIKARLNG